MLDGKFLANVTRPELEKIFAGNIEMPMLDEKLEVLHQVGSVLAEKYDGRFHNFIKSCSPLLYDNGNGLVERMAKEFPRFNDVSQYDGHEIKFYKLAQLGLWFAWATYPKDGPVRLNDVEKMTHVPRTTSFRSRCDCWASIAIRRRSSTQSTTYQLIPRNSTQEVEIRAHSIYATALLREEINKIRPPELQVIIPQVNERLWTHYHTTFLAAPFDAGRSCTEIVAGSKRLPRRGNRPMKAQRIAAMLLGAIGALRRSRHVRWPRKKN